MPRLFVGNFDFEHSLANRHYQPSQRLQRLNAERAVSWLAVAEEGDYLWSPVPVSSKILALENSLGLPRLKLVTNWDDVRPGTELVPWGWTDVLQQRARLQRLEFTAPPPAAVRDVNSRKFSFELETEWQVGLPGASMVRDLAELEAAIANARLFADQLVIKANWSMAGRERILIADQPTDADLAWIRSRLHHHGAIFVEPWVARVAEAGIQIQISQSGLPQLIGVSQLICDSRGQYGGSWFADLPNAAYHWQPAVDVAMRAAARLQDRGYFGPLGIDAMRYRLHDGSLNLRPLMDINARWTMGRLSLGWRKYLQPGESGLWWHHDPLLIDKELLQGHQVVRTLPLAMPLVGAHEIASSSFVVFLQEEPRTK